jgi:hypothetical protein
VAAATGLQWFSDLEGILPQLDEHTRRLCHMSEIGKQAVGDVDHGCGSCPGSDRTGSVADLGHAVGLDEDPG